MSKLLVLTYFFQTGGIYHGKKTVKIQSKRPPAMRVAFLAPPAAETIKEHASASVSVRRTIREAYRFDEQ